MNDLILYFSLPALGVVFLAAGFRFWRGPSAADRVIAWDLISVSMMGLLLLCYLLTSQTYLIDVFLILAVLSFLATIGYAHALPRRSEEMEAP